MGEWQSESKVLGVIDRESASAPTQVPTPVGGTKTGAGANATAIPSPTTLPSGAAAANGTTDATMATIDEATEPLEAPWYPNGLINGTLPLGHERLRNLQHS